MKGPRYTTEEQAAIRAAFTAGGKKAAYLAAPNRTRNGIYNFLLREELIEQEPHYGWHPHQDELLKRLWNIEPRIPVRLIAKEVGHSYGAVFRYVYLNAKRLGLKSRARPKKATPGQRGLAGREAEHLIERVMVATGLPRSTVNHLLIDYLMRDAKRAKVEQYAQAIVDIGGMVDMSIQHSRGRKVA